MAHDVMLYISDEWIRKNITVDEAMTVVENTFRADGLGEVTLSDPPACTLDAQNDAFASYKIKGAIVPSCKVAGFRLISFGHLSGNANENKRVGGSYSYLADLETGVPVALVNEGWQYALRSGLMAPVALKYIGPKSPKTAAVIGAGRLSRAVMLGLTKTAPVSEIRVTAKDLEEATAYAAEVGPTAGAAVRPVATVKEAVEGADVVVTVSNADTIILKPEWLKKGATVCTLGGALELDPAMLQWADKFIVDDFEWCKMAGSIGGWLRKGLLNEEQIASHIYATIGQVVAGRKPGRENAEENILSITQGMASCDLSLARFLYDRAKDAPDVCRIELK